jgi:hypothetical protein
MDLPQKQYREKIAAVCADCKSPEHICNMWPIIEGHLPKDRIHIKLVGKDLGY